MAAAGAAQAAAERCLAAEIEWTRKIRNMNWQIAYAIRTPHASEANTAQINITEAITLLSQGPRNLPGFPAAILILSQIRSFATSYFGALLPNRVTPCGPKPDWAARAWIPLRVPLPPDSCTLETWPNGAFRSV